MGIGIPMINLRQVATCMIFSLWLVSCTNYRSISAPISNISCDKVKNQKTICNDSHIISKRIYESISRGRFSNKTYTVKQGDTLFYIAWITGKHFLDLAEHNNIPIPYRLQIGQKIQCDHLSFNKDRSILTVIDATGSGIPRIPSSNQIETTIVNYEVTKTHSNEEAKNKLSPVGVRDIVSHMAIPIKTLPVSSHVFVRSWIWPTDGKIINNFSLSEGGNKGIDIVGTYGEPVLAAADGRVVYAGNALRGYGNLVIIKHNDDYLSAYAHNATILVREQQAVKAGQKVATMGDTGTSSVRLHFEIRYKGKSVNPLGHLPPR